MKNNHKFQTGFTMLEVLVAMTLGVIVLGAAIGMQVSHQRGFKITETKLNMQTNAKFAYEFIASNLRELGAVGCRTVSGYYGPGDSGARNVSGYHIAFNNEDVPYADFREHHELTGHENTEGSGVWTPAMPAQFGFVATMLDGSDAITMRGAVGKSYRVDDGDVDAATGAITLNVANNDEIDLMPDQYAVLSQCAFAEVFKITGTEADIKAGKIGHGAGTLGDDNQAAAFVDKFDVRSVAELRRVAVNTYYVANNPNGVPTLYRDTDNVSDPLVEGVERMQIEYGVKGSDAASPVNVPIEYHTADWFTVGTTEEQEGKWSRVVMIRLSFIMRSREPVYEKDTQQNYSLPGVVTYTYQPNDRFARLIYTSTVNLRNRTLGKRT